MRIAFKVFVLSLMVIVVAVTAGIANLVMDDIVNRWKKQDATPQRAEPIETRARPTYVTPVSVLDNADEDLREAYRTRQIMERPMDDGVADSGVSYEGNYILNRANDYGNGASVPIAPPTQDVRTRFGADGRYAQPQPSPRSYDHR